MTDRKHTDDEIIKALELCFTPKGTKDTCAKCPFHKFRALCKVERDRAALDLLHRQKAEIERLKKIGDDKTSEILRHATAIGELHKQLETAKSEAIKEFAQRLRKRARMPLGTLYRAMVYLKDIDTLVKEMTEENK
jgi:hypothetical protein